MARYSNYTGASDVLVIILAILLPPVAVFIKRGCGAQLLLNIVLWLLGHIPGAIHAVYIVLHDEGERVRRQSAPYQQQTNNQALYGAYGDNTTQLKPDGGRLPEPYYDQPRAIAPEPMPTTYTEQQQPKGEKQEYAPVANDKLTEKEI